MNEGNDRRQHPRVPFVREVKVARLSEINTLVARDLSQGGLFLDGAEASVGETLTIEFTADELPGVRFRGEVEVVRRSTHPPGVGARFVRFAEGGTALARLITFLLEPE